MELIPESFWESTKFVPTDLVNFQNDSETNSVQNSIFDTVNSDA